MSIVREDQIGSLNYTTPKVILVEVSQSPNARAASSNVVALVVQAIRGQVGKIYSVGSLIEYEKKLGGYNSNTDYLYVKNFFDGNGSILKVVRVASTGTMLASVNVQTTGAVTIFSITADTVGSWGNSIEAVVSNNPISGYFNISIRNKATQEIKQYNKVTTDSDDSRYLPTLIASDTGLFFTVAMSLTDGTVPPSAVYTATNGSDGSQVGSSLADSAYVGLESGGVRTGIQAFKASSAEDVSIIVSARNSATINSALLVHVSDIKLSPRRTILINPVGTSVDGAVTSMQTLDNEKAKMAFPYVKVTNPFTGVLETANPVAFDAANDTLLSYHQSASQTAYPATVVELEYELTPNEVDTLTGNRINPIVLRVGRGFIRASDYTTASNPALAQNTVRKAKDFFAKTFYDLLQNFISKPITPKLWKDIRDAMTAFLRNEATNERIGNSSGGAAFGVKVDSENNPTDIVKLNRIRIDTQISLLANSDIIEIYLDASQDKTVTNA